MDDDNDNTNKLQTAINLLIESQKRERKELTIRNAMLCCPLTFCIENVFVKTHLLSKKEKNEKENQCSCVNVIFYIYKKRIIIIGMFQEEFL